MIHRSGRIHRLSLVFGIATALLLGGYSLGSGAVTRAQADSAYTAWYNLYWNKSNNTFYKRDDRTGRIDFWRYAHDWEVMMDRFELTRDSLYVRQMKDAWNGFHKTNGMGTDWKQNDFNDDIEWWIISATRAYSLTKDTVYGNTAKRNFDWVYSTQWDMSLGGGIWWKNTERGSKNACSNGPGSYAAMNLYKIYNDTSYLNKAKAIYKWERGSLFNAGTGAVADNMRANGSVSGGPLFYNQGTFLGSAYLLFKATGDSSYYRDAVKTADYVRNNMSNRTTGILNNGGYTGDFSAFLLIFVRDMMQFVIEGQQGQYRAWMTLNAETAWKNRRKSDDIMSSNFSTVPPASGLESSSSSGGVALLTLAVLANQPVGIVIQRKKVPADVFGTKAVDLFSIDGRSAKTSGNGHSKLLLERASNGERTRLIYER
ncbi:MAG: carbohydrate-binding protein [Fibrobacteres bacterium]|nr:carbohydrate-binding protein [Fibrobacterota bacterium]